MLPLAELRKGLVPQPHDPVTSGWRSPQAWGLTGPGAFGNLRSSSL